MAMNEHRLKTCATGQESIITFAIERSIKDHPEQAAAEMLKLIRVNADLEAELFFLRERLGELARMGRRAG